MSGVDSLPGDQRAVLQLVLGRRRSYDDIAQMLSIKPGAVRDRAHAALASLGPQTRLDEEVRDQITDYLLGQLSSSDADGVRIVLAASPAERAWARVVSGELVPLAGSPLPEIPVDATRERPVRVAAPMFDPMMPDVIAPPPGPPQPDPEPPPPGPPEPDPEPRPRTEPVPPAAPGAAPPPSAEDEPEPPPQADPAPAPQADPAPAPQADVGPAPQADPEPPGADQATAAAPAEPERPPVPAAAAGPPRAPRSSRLGGLIVIGVVLAAVIIGVVVLLASGASSKQSATTTSTTTGTADTPAASATTPAASATTPAGSATIPGATATTSGAAGQTRVVAQINLVPTAAGSKAAGIAEVLRQGTTSGVAIVAQNMAANATKPPNAYAVWLYNSPGDAKILGFVNPRVGASGKFSTASGVPTNAAHYKQLIVTLETTSRPTRPGSIVLQGAATGL